MRHRLITTTLTTLLFLTMVAPGSAQGPKAVADQAVKLLSAYKTTDAAQLLAANKEKHGSSAYYKGAAGLANLCEGKLEAAVNQLNKAANQNKNDPAADFFRGEALYWQKNNDAAAAAWKRSRDRAKALVDAHPDDPRANYYLGAARVRMKDFANARSALNKAKQGGFSKAMVQYQIGLSFAFEKKWDKSKNAFNAAINADSGFAPAYFFRARVWKELKRTDQMMLDLDRFLKLAPQSLESPIAKSLLAAGGG